MSAHCAGDEGRSGHGEKPLTQQLLSGRPDESKDGRVFQPSLDRDRVEMMLEVIQLSNHLHPILAADLLLDH